MPVNARPSALEKGNWKKLPGSGVMMGARSYSLILSPHMKRSARIAGECGRDAKRKRMAHEAAFIFTNAQIASVQTGASLDHDFNPQRISHRAPDEEGRLPGPQSKSHNSRMTLPI
ncbi:uncharacterized protein VTP21DRAFT_1082 [Calcarisporiella thermophila]|uniref:uncharacterized protein n=1 Tax=Calcarisporiella thermophila TaxID=911321 RepID=UPI0037438D05